MESESSHFDGRVEAFGASSERHLTGGEVKSVLVEFVHKENGRPSEEEDVEMAGTEDEPQEFSTVTPIYPQEGYSHDIPDVEDDDPKEPADGEDEEDHELPRFARLASLRAKHLAPASLFALPSQYQEYDQDKIIRAYFDGVNPATPLFSEQDYEYFDMICRERATVSHEWCAVFVMLALSLRNDPKNYYQGDDENFMHKACKYVDGMLKYRLSDEIGLQILLGAALYFMTTPRLEQAALLHAKAVKLVYGLGLHKHSGDFAQLYDVRLLWIAYIIDRDISLLTREPYLMQEHDIASTVEEISYRHGGILHDINKSSHFEILNSGFEAVFRPARDGGGSFFLDEMLEEWVESIPEPYRGDTLSDFGHMHQRFFKQLRVAYYHCIFSIRQATLRNKEWVRRLLRFGEARKGDDTDTPLLPSNWSGLVTAAQKCLDIVNKVDSRDMAFRWSCTYATQAAMTILAANNITLSEHDLQDSIDKDQQTLHIAHGEASDRLDQDPTRSTEKSFNTCGELIIKARESVRQFNEGKSMEES
ncbi:uncharacterized protein FFMR_03635 [Fusarium fujikuroi]|nr:uncharacterized protein FFMR_03635 [Fusarium fujikuroi]